MRTAEFPAGGGQLIVVYMPDDVGTEVDPIAIYEAMAADAVDRTSQGYWIVSTSTMHARHAGTFMGRDGSGFTTKVALTVVYARTEQPAPPQG